MSNAELSNINANGIETIKVDSQPVTSAKELENFIEAIKPFAGKMLDQQLKNAEESIAAKDLEIEELKKVIINQSKRISKQDDKIELLEDKICGLNDVSGQTTDDFPYQFDCRDFQNDKKENPSPEWTRNFWGNMFKLVGMTNNVGKHIINCAAHVVYIYKVISESRSIPYKYIGKQMDFVYRWNVNVVSRLKDKIRAKKLACQEKSFNSALGKIQSVVSWSRLSTEGKHKDMYSLACDIKVTIEKLVA